MLQITYTPINGSGKALDETTLETESFETIEDMFTEVIDKKLAWYKPVKKDGVQEDCVAKRVGMVYYDKIEAMRRSAAFHAAAKSYRDGKHYGKLTLDPAGRKQVSSSLNFSAVLDDDRKLKDGVNTSDIEADVTRHEDGSVTFKFRVETVEKPVEEKTASVKKSVMEEYFAANPEAAAALEKLASKSK